MGIFSKNEVLLTLDAVRIGEVDPTNETGTGYRNVVTYSFDVSKNRVVRAHVVSDAPVSAVIANENGSLAGHADEVTDAVLGPFPTAKNKTMGLILGLYPGDKATVSVKVWADSK